MKVDEIPGKMRRKSKESLIWNSKFERQSPNQILVLEKERESEGGWDKTEVRMGFGRSVKRGIYK